MHTQKDKCSSIITGKTDLFSDNRGRFARLFCSKEFEKILAARDISQINLSESFIKGTIRGMHYQKPPFCEMKIIYCLSGRIFDVAVDIRRNSKNFLEWNSTILDSKNLNFVIIPEGFAHGFQALTDDVAMMYIHTAPYNKEHEGTIRFDDPRIKILWPLKPSNLSDKDLEAVFLSDSFKGIICEL